MLLDNPIIGVMPQYPINPTSGQLIILQDRGLRYHDRGFWKSGHADFDFINLAQFSGTTYAYSSETRVTVRTVILTNIAGIDITVTLKRNGVYLLRNASLVADQTVTLDIAIPLTALDNLTIESSGQIACSLLGSDSDDYDVIAIGSNLNIVSEHMAVITDMVLCNTSDVATTVTVKLSFSGVANDAAIFIKDLPLAVGESVFGDIKHVLPTGGRLIVEGVGVDVLFSGGVYN